MNKTEINWYEETKKRLMEYAVKKNILTTKDWYQQAFVPLVSLSWITAPSFRCITRQSNQNYSRQHFPSS